MKKKQNVVSGHRFIGGVIGDKDSQKSYIHGKVDGWVKCVQQLYHMLLPRHLKQHLQA